MRVRSIAWSLVGGVLVFAACAVQRADERGVLVEDDAGSALVDAVRDSLGVEVEPAKDAKAEPPIVSAAKCAISSEPAGGGAFFAYATILRPGTTKESLARATVLACTEGAAYCTVGTYGANIMQVKDGELRYRCGVVSTAADAEKTTVTFTFPTP